MGGNALPGFTLEAAELDIVLCQDSGLTLEEEKEYACPEEGCEERCSSLCKFIAHLDDHRKRNVQAKYFARHQ